MGRVVVPFDGGRAGTHMLAMACDTAVERADEVEAVYVLRIPPQVPINADLPAARERADAIFARAHDLAGRFPLAFTTVLVEARHVGMGLVAAAEGANLLMMGLPARRRLFRRARFTPTLYYVLTHAPCEVLAGYVPLAASGASAPRFLHAGAVSATPGVSMLDNVRVLRIGPAAAPHTPAYAERRSPAGGAGRR